MCSLGQLDLEIYASDVIPKTLTELGSIKEYEEKFFQQFIVNSFESNLNKLHL